MDEFKRHSDFVERRIREDISVQFMTATMDFHEEKGLSYEFNEYFKKWLEFRGLATRTNQE